MEGRTMLKDIAHQTFTRLVRYGRVLVTYWDGTTRLYEGSRGLDEPMLRVTIADQRVVKRLLVNASLAVGEGYAKGQLQISEDQLPLFFKLIARNQPDRRLPQPFWRRRNHKEAQQGYIESHYDVLFLDATCLYSCAYFAHEDDTLEAAQQQKIGHILRKLRLERDMWLLDVGCGWGHLAVVAAKQYGVRVTGITLSAEQLRGAQELAQREGVEDLVEFRRCNYQDLPDSDWYDRVVSVGMYEHVGRGNRDQYFSKVEQHLRPGGISLLHTITQQQPRPVDAWIDKYIFPGGYLPTVSEIEEGLAQHGLWSIDRENMWWHYAETLRHWRERHRKHRSTIVDMFDEEFYLSRDLWLAGSEAGFRHGQLGLTQVVFTKGKPRDGSWPRTRGYLYE